MPRFTDWLIYLGVVLAMLAASYGRREQVNAPAAPPPVPGADQAPISPSSPFAEANLVHIGGGRPNHGTAFAVNDRGVWLTAAGAVAGCGRPAIVVADGWAAPAKILGGVGDVVVLAAQDGAPALLFARRAQPATGPARVPYRLLARDAGRGGDHLPRPGRRAPRLGRDRPHRRPEGTPVRLCRRAGAGPSGMVAGMVLADAPRRGMVTAATPAALTLALAAAKQTVGGAQAPQPIARDNYGRAADVLRRATSVVAVDCM